MSSAFLPLLATVAVIQPPVAEEYPIDAVLAAFATACSGVENTAVNLASADAAGWVRLPENSDSPVSKLTRAGKQAVMALAADGATITTLDGGEFRKEVSGRTLYLAISGTRQGNINVRGCRLYDFAAPAAPTSKQLHDWSGRDPNDSQASQQSIVRHVFNPGLKPGHMEMEIFYIPPGTTLVPGFELSGLSLVASALEL